MDTIYGPCADTTAHFNVLSRKGTSQQLLEFAAEAILDLGVRNCHGWVLDPESTPRREGGYPRMYPQLAVGFHAMA
jgi:hypothetical protein